MAASAYNQPSVAQPAERARQGCIRHCEGNWVLINGKADKEHDDTSAFLLLF